MAKASADDESLERLGGGRWQTRDERFTIEPESGTWVVVDGEQTDDLGLPLIRGPFGSLTAARAAIGEARRTGPPVRPLPRPKAVSTASVSARTTPKARPSTPAPPPTEPRWIADLTPAARRGAREAIARLAAAGAPDPEGIARRDLSGGVPAIAAFALIRRLRQLGPDAAPDVVVELLGDGRDDDLGVRWRIVDGAGRPIVLTPSPIVRGAR